MDTAVKYRDVVFMAAENRKVPVLRVVNFVDDTQIDDEFTVNHARLNA